MYLFSYIVARDFGFAPNPFNGICSLATCKAKIRKTAVVGDWVIGTGSKKKIDISGRLIFAMKVTEKITFNEYWNDMRFLIKRPHMNGGLKQAFGDNIYFFDNTLSLWHQEDSHHSYPNGVINNHNLARDTRHPFVLLSNYFYYFGRNHIEIPDKLKDICIKTQGYKKNHPVTLVSEFIEWLENHYDKGFNGNNPIQFDSFERYNGM